MPELRRLAFAVQYRSEDLEEAEGDAEESNVIHIGRIGLRRKTDEKSRRSDS